MSWEYDIVWCDKIVFMIISSVILNNQFDIEWIKSFLLSLAILLILRLLAKFKYTFYLVSSVFSLFWSVAATFILHLFLDGFFHYEMTDLVFVLSLIIFFFGFMYIHLDQDSYIPLPPLNFLRKRRLKKKNYVPTAINNNIQSDFVDKTNFWNNDGINNAALHNIRAVSHALNELSDRNLRNVSELESEINWLQSIQYDLDNKIQEINNTLFNLENLSRAVITSANKDSLAQIDNIETLSNQLIAEKEKLLKQQSENDKEIYNLKRINQTLTSFTNSH